MNNHLFVFLLICLPIFARTQAINRSFMSDGLVAFRGPLLKASSDGWLLAENIYSAIPNGYMKSRLTRIDSTGKIIWECSLNEYMFLKDMMVLPGDQTLLLATRIACRTNNGVPFLLTVDAKGSLVNTEQLVFSGTPFLTGADIKGVRAQPAADALWIELYSSITEGYHIVKRQISTGKYTYISPALEDLTNIEILPGSVDMTVWHSNSGIDLYQDTVRLKRLAGFGTAFNKPLGKVKLYPVAPQIAVILGNGDVLLLNINGDYTLVEETHASDMDLRNGNDLICYGFYWGDGVQIPNYFGTFIKRYTGPGFKTRTQVRSPFNTLGFSHEQIRWNNDHLMILLASEKGVYKKNNSQSTQFVWLKSTRFHQLYSLHPDDIPDPAPDIHDAGVTRIQSGDPSWWYPFDTLGFNYFKTYNLDVQVTNHGDTPLHSFTLCSYSSAAPGTDCYEDKPFIQRYDGYNIQPGQSIRVNIPELPLAVTAPAYGLDSVCIWVILPNDQPDTNYTNDYHCIGAERRRLPDPDQFRVFPNPVHDWLYVSLPVEGYQLADYQISNALGQVVSEGLVAPQAGYWVINTATLGAGVYMLRTRAGTFKFVKN